MNKLKNYFSDNPGVLVLALVFASALLAAAIIISFIGSSATAAVVELQVSESDTVSDIGFGQTRHSNYMTIELTQDSSDSIDEFVVLSERNRVVGSSSVVPNAERVRVPMDHIKRNEEYVLQSMKNGEVIDRTTIELRTVK